MDAIDGDEHVRITRRGKDHVNGVLTPEAWYEQAKHALAIVTGLTAGETDEDEGRMMTMAAGNVPSGIGAIMDAIDADAHVRITRRGKDHVNGVLTPEAWYEQAKHALAIVTGLTQLGQGIKPAPSQQGKPAPQQDLFGEREVMATAS